MDDKIIDNLTKSIEYISCLTLSGGEPSLNPDAITHLIYSMYKNNCSFHYFWTAINARRFRKQFYDAIWELYYTSEAQEDCVLTISGDQFHELRSDKAVNQYEALPFYSNSKMRFINDEHVINEGMAKTNYIGMQEAKKRSIIFSYDWDPASETLTIEDDIYVNAKGDVLLCCDLSYESQKKHAIGNVLVDSLDDILLRRLPVKSLPVEEAS